MQIHRRIPRGLLAGGLALTISVIAAAGLLAFARSTSAVAPDEITIGSSSDGGSVAVGSTFTVTLAVTQSTTPYTAVQWEIAYPQNVSFVSPATYTCSQFPSESESQPSEDSSGSA